VASWQAAWRLAEGLPCAAEIATAKFWAADAGHRVAHTAVHICTGWARNWPGPRLRGHAGKMPLPAVMAGS
jgi:alkylation response protein AidB-like acyl-CoA dehydrogenase